MPFDRAIRQYTGRHLVPVIRTGKEYELPVNLAPNTFFALGRVLAQYNASANDVQTSTITGGPTGGDVLFTLANPHSGAIGTFRVPYNATNVVAQTAIVGLAGAGNYTVGGGPWPGTPLVFTAAGRYANMPVLLMKVASFLTGGTAPAVTIAKTAHGRSKGTYGWAADGGAAGLDVARCIISYACTTDSAGNITLGEYAQEGYAGEVFPDVPAWHAGVFDTKELVGLTATMVPQLGRLTSGTVADGQLAIE
jgi:hypothetical protein